MFTSRAPKRIANPYLRGLIVLGALATAACDPGDIKELLEGHGSHSTPPSTGTGGGTSVPPTTGVDGGTSVPPSSCAAVLCLTGTHCEEQAVECIKAPCPAHAVCVPNQPEVSCGGFGGKPCPGSGACVDDPGDSCDPKSGGADCIGICQCVQNVACVKGAKFDPSPGVCACVNPTPPPSSCGPVCQIYCENGNVLDAKGCPTCACNPPPTDPCATVRCAAGTHCEATKVECIKAPCPAVAQCVPDAPPPTCGPVCAIYCEFGNVLNAAGCPTCACNPPTATKTCPVEKCTGAAPKSATYLCPDGKTTAGPSCRVNANGACVWAVISCPA